MVTVRNPVLLALFVCIVVLVVRGQDDHKPQLSLAFIERLCSNRTKLNKSYHNSLGYIFIKWI